MIVLASTSPQRRAILEQLEIPFRVLAPDYEETGDDPVEHAAGKARSVTEAATRCSVSTRSSSSTARAREARNELQAGEMLSMLAGRTHEVVSGLCLRSGDREELARETTSVTFRPLAADEIVAYVATGEWEGEPADTRSRNPARRSSSGSTATT